MGTLLLIPLNIYVAHFLNLFETGDCCDNIDTAIKPWSTSYLRNYKANASEYLENPEEECVRQSIVMYVF